MKKEIKQWSHQFLTFHIPRWEELPNFDLYSDQVIQLIQDYLAPFDQEDNAIITGAMINNYVKHKMMPKPIKKKYQKVHIAYLISISLLKQVLTIEQVNAGITYQAEVSGLKNAYNMFCEEAEEALKNVALQIQGRENEMDIGIDENRQAMAFATKAFAYKCVADKIVEINLSERENKDEEK